MVLRFTPFRETGSRIVSQLFFESESQKLLDRQLFIAIFICGCQQFIHGFIVPFLWVKGFQDLTRDASAQTIGRCPDPSMVCITTVLSPNGQ